MTVTATFDGSVGVLVCRTRDISLDGVYLDTPKPIDVNTRVELSLLDQDRGAVVELEGVVVRQVAAAGEAKVDSLAIRLIGVPPPWKDLVERAQKSATRAADSREESKRLRILVVGDEKRRRGALALYVTSGWDIQFATELVGAKEALEQFRVDAVIAETDLEDKRWLALLGTAKCEQPWARRLVRAHLRGGAAPKPGGADALVHRVVDFDAGLDALVDALTAPWASAETRLA